MIIRPALREDLPGILAIENDEIRHGFAHFGETALLLADVIENWSRTHERFPWLVAVDHGEVAGFTRAGAWKTREAYHWTTELGVYVRPASQGQGVGRQLYTALFPMLEAAGFRTIVAGIVVPNAPSVRLHEAFGMTHVGTFERQGFKHGQWRDVGYWQRHCGEGDPGPT